MRKKISILLLLILATVLPTIAIWTPFLLRAKSVWGIPLPTNGMASIVANYDGPLYIVVAKTLYNADAIKSMYNFNLPVEYYAAHFPLFPLLIKGGSLLLGYPYAMLFVTIITSLLALFFFYKLSRIYLKEKDAMFLTLLFSIFPARWLIVRSIGSPDPLFVASIIGSVYFFKKQKYFWAGVLGAIAQLTKSPGILLFVAYIAVIFTEKVISLANISFGRLLKSVNLARFIPILLIPLALFGIFWFYKQTFGDFLAYFNSGDNIHLFFPPFQIFNYSAPWVGTFWLEEVIFIYLFGALAITQLFKKKDFVLGWVTLIYFLSTLFVAHRDLLRYSLPFIPFLLISFSDFLTKKEFKIALIVIIIPIYLFSLSFISQNIMPISDWAPFL